MIVDGMELFEDDDLARPASPSHSKVKRAVARAQFLSGSNSASLAAYASIHHTFDFAPY
jgi:hypothetical protein